MLLLLLCITERKLAGLQDTVGEELFNIHTIQYI